MRLPLTGGCQCGRVRYQIRAEPLAVYVCHCTECQRQSGSAFALSLAVARDALVVDKGAPAVWRREVEGGRMIDCMFCGGGPYDDEPDIDGSCARPGNGVFVAPGP